MCEETRCRINGYLDLSEGEALMHHVRVREGYRRKYIFSAMAYSMAATLLEGGIVTRVLCDFDVRNQGTRRGLDKVGFKPLGSGIYIQLLGRLVYRRFHRMHDGAAHSG